MWQPNYIYSRKPWEVFRSTYCIFLYAWHLKIYSNSVSLAPPFGIPIDLIHNTNQKINANISKRAKIVLAYIYILLSSHQAVTAHSHHFNDMFSAKAKPLQNHNFQIPTPSLPSLYIYLAQEINEFTKFTIFSYFCMRPFLPISLYLSIWSIWRYRKI